ncbi:ArnT family glycosyltransferase [Maioricimonas rarisocia]|nr:glycosyltransferase family 39 protein [Maioricimonas rarisocia]
MSVVCAVVVHVLLLVWGIMSHSPVVDEVGHLSAGIIHWQTGDYRPYRVNPPLVRAIAVIPVLPLLGDTPVPHSPPIWDGDRTEFRDGLSLLQRAGDRYLLMIRLARLMCLPFSVLGLVMTWRWSSELYGALPGAAAAWLWCFSPTVLGHGALITPDVPAAALLVTTMFILWRWWKSPRFDLSVQLGLVLGLALSMKYTSLVALPVAGTAAVIAAARCPDWSGRQRIGSQFLVWCLLSVVVVNAVYGFRGSLVRLGDYRFVSAAFTGGAGQTSVYVTGNRFRDRALSSIPVPLPKEYLAGIDLQQRDFESHLRSYLRGEWRQGGWWYYYLYCFLVKVPVGTLVLLLLAVLGSATGRRLRTGELFVLAPALLVIAIASAKYGFSHHFRYVLPALPFLLIFSSKAVVTVPGRRVLRMVSRSAVVLSICASLAVAPHWLSFFNILVGGPSYGRYHLLNSNVDWGQDLLFLREWIESTGGREPIALAYFGLCDPALLGINAVPAEDFCGGRGVEPRYIAVSANLLHGGTSAMWLGGREYRVGGEEFVCLRDQEPAARAGYSILIFDRTRLENDGRSTH